MPFQKGKARAEGAGRKKGTPNKWTRKVEDIALKYKLDPFEVLLMFACADWKALGYDSDVYHVEKPDGSVKMGYVISPEMRLKAAEAAARYLYSTKQSVALGTNESGIKIIVEDYSKKNE